MMRVILRLKDLGIRCNDPIKTSKEAFERPAPGVDGIMVEVLTARVIEDDIITVLLFEPLDYVRQSFILGGELEIGKCLVELRDNGLSEEDISELIDCLRDDPEVRITAIRNRDGSFEFFDS